MRNSNLAVGIFVSLALLIFVSVTIWLPGSQTSSRSTTWNATGPGLETAGGGHSVSDALSQVLVNLHGADLHPGFQAVERSAVGDALASDWQAASLSGHEQIEIAYPVINRDRAVGTRLSGEVETRFPGGLTSGAISVRLAGTAGQSLGAFLTQGIDIRLDGTANDFVGKGQGGGSITVVPRVDEAGPAHGAGNAVLYGATGGRLFISGPVGQRFAVRNSGAVAVVEGCSDHGCEYMTGGTAVVLGATGRNLAAGMTGGVLFVWDPQTRMARRLADTAPPARRPSVDEAVALKDLIEDHYWHTNSRVAREILADWPNEHDRFWVLVGAPGPSQDLEAGREGTVEDDQVVAAG